jgi:hypothetical protein
VRQRLAGLLIAALLVGAGVGAYLWYRHENGTERAVHAQLRTRGISADWVSCSNDHTVRAGASTVTYYRCDLHGSQERRDGLVPVGSEVCVPFVGGRVATEAEIRLIRLEDGFCENFG